MFSSLYSPLGFECSSNPLRSVSKYHESMQRLVLRYVQSLDIGTIECVIETVGSDPVWKYEDSILETWRGTWSMIISPRYTGSMLAILIPNNGLFSAWTHCTVSHE